MTIPQSKCFESLLMLEGCSVHSRSTVCILASKVKLNSVQSSDPLTFCELTPSRTLEEDLFKPLICCDNKPKREQSMF